MTERTETFIGGWSHPSISSMAPGTIPDEAAREMYELLFDLASRAIVHPRWYLGQDGVDRILAILRVASGHPRPVITHD